MNQDNLQPINDLQPIRGLNFVELTPISFLKRAADTYAERPAVLYGEREYTWRQTAARCRRLASALRGLGVERGDTVSFLAANTPELIEAHYGVAMAGGVLNAINTRLDAGSVAYILSHSDCRVFVTDSQFSAVAKRALAELAESAESGKTESARLPTVIDIVDEQAPPSDDGESGERLGEMTYEELLSAGDPAADWGYPASEWDSLTLNYTSGTSGRPKGVLYHHRGAYLMAMGTIAAWEIPRHPRYLYTVPLFHCNGWGHAWTMTAMGGTLICNRLIRAEVIFDALVRHRITHFGAAPIILAMLADAPAEVRKRMENTVQVMTAGAPPPSKVLEKIEQLNFNVTHVYGLTETYGHVVYCEARPDWRDLTGEQLAELKARQGVRLPMLEAATVLAVDGKDGDGAGQPVAADGKSMGEIALRGNTVMKGYHKNPQATAEAFAGGWFRSGDLAVVHADGYIEIKDRLKDIIISGGENISSIEVESALYKHPQVAAAAVVAKPHPKWGESPCAFVELQPGESADADDIIAFCREHLSGFKLPKQVVFMELPKTSTGKIQKFRLREMARGGEV